MPFDAKLYRLASTVPVIPAQTYPTCCCSVAVADCRTATDFDTSVTGSAYSQIPMNDCTGPGSFVAYTRLVKNFGVGPQSKGSASGRGTDSGRSYNLSLGVQFQNLFNDADLAPPQGVLTSPRFGRSTQLAGAPFTSADTVRHVNLLASFSF